VSDLKQQKPPEQYEIKEAFLSGVC
jgi:hypothetical protein